MAFMDQIEVASPCPASWDAMEGTDQVRFCGQCRMNVYNFSEMTADEAEALIRNTEGRVCGRFYRREDGTVLTKDCPVGIAALRRRVAALGASIAAGLALMLGLFGWRSAQASVEERAPRRLPTVSETTPHDPATTTPPSHPSNPAMGGVAVRPPTPPRPGQHMMGAVAKPLPPKPPIKNPRVKMGKIACPPPKKPQVRQGRVAIEPPRKVAQPKPKQPMEMGEVMVRPPQKKPAKR